MATQDDFKEIIPMKQFKCNSCNKIWFVDNEDEHSVMTCPFCGFIVRQTGVIKNINTLGKAIYTAISDRGLDILSTNGKISGYLLDIAPEMKKEIRIFSRVFDNNSLSLYRNAFEEDISSIDGIINQLKRLFIEEEGLSESWADLICENCQKAILYFRGEDLPEIISAEITDCSKNSNIQSENGKLASVQDLRSEQQLYVATLKIGDSVRFGRIDGNDSSPMFWSILDSKEDENGRKLFLLHYEREDIEHNFHVNNKVTDWSRCYLREWLNHDFYISNFNDLERAIIRHSEIKTWKRGNDENGDYSESKDRLFCLSVDEARQYSPNIKATFHPWLLRDVAVQPGYICTYENGEPYKWGVYAKYTAIVRPAMYVDAACLVALQPVPDFLKKV